MTNPQKRKGDDFERDVRDWFTDQRGFIAARPRAGNPLDHGDIALRTPGDDIQLPWHIDCKNHQRLAIPEWWRSLVIEAEQHSTPTRRVAPLLIVKRTGISSAGKALAIVHLEDLEL